MMAQVVREESAEFVEIEGMAWSVEAVNLMMFLVVVVQAVEKVGRREIF
jgi:hypothetical protein